MPIPLADTAVRLWRLLVEPHPSLTDLEDRGKARMLAIIQLLMPGILLVIWSIPSTELLKFEPASRSFFIGFLLCIALSYALSRTRYYGVGVVVFTLGLMGFIFATILIDRSVDAFQIMSVYLAHAVFVAGLLLPLLPTLGIELLAMAGVMLVASQIPNLRSDLVFDQLAFLGSVNLLVLGATFGRAKRRRRFDLYAARLKESEDRYRTLFEASFEPLLIHDLGVIIDANPALETITGYGSHETQGKSVLEFVRPDHHEQVIQKSNSVAPQHYEITCLRKDGSEFLAEVLSKPYMYQGRQVRVVSIRDLTVQRETEAQRLELVLTRERQSIQQKLISNLSHDFRTPLSVVKTSLYLLERSTADPTRHQKHIEVIRGQTQRLQEMLDDFIMLTRLDYARKADFDTSPVNLDLLLRQMVDEFQEVARKNQQTLVYESRPPLAEIPVDESALRRVLKNLLANALNFTPADGTVTVSATLEDATVSIAIRDTGMGIAVADLPHIFDHFYRADLARSMENGGTGLGLTIARKLVEMMGGEINVQTEEGIGSTFTLTLPMHQAQLLPDAIPG